MSEQTELYTILAHLNNPGRYLGFTYDELGLNAMFLLMLMLSNHKIAVGVVWGIVYSLLKAIKKGKRPSYLLLMAYWHLPHAIMRWLLPNLTPSHLRIWTE